MKTLDTALNTTESTPARLTTAWSVDESCIGCTLCRTLAPEGFAGAPDGRSYVTRPPANDQELQRYRWAAHNCPVAAIREHILAADHSVAS